MQHSIENQMFVRTIAGSNDREPILYLHGLGESGLCFERLARHPLLAELPQLIPDLPGYGRSPWPAEPLSFVALVDHLAEWLTARGQRPVTVVGHSLGGVLALLLTERHANLVARVVDVDGNICADDCVFSGQAAAMSLDEFCTGGFDDMRGRIYLDGTEDEALRGYYASLRLCDPRAYHLGSTELVQASRRGDLATRLARLAAPVLYVAGAPDGASPRSRELLDRAGVRTVEIGPAGHWPFIDDADGFVAALMAFLAVSG